MWQDPIADHSISKTDHFPRTRIKTRVRSMAVALPGKNHRLLGVEKDPYRDVEAVA